MRHQPPSHVASKPQHSSAGSPNAAECGEHDVGRVQRLPRRQGDVAALPKSRTGHDSGEARRDGLNHPGLVEAPVCSGFARSACSISGGGPGVTKRVRNDIEPAPPAAPPAVSPRGSSSMPSPCSSPYVRLKPPPEQETMTRDRLNPDATEPRLIERRRRAELNVPPAPRFPRVFPHRSPALVGAGRVGLATPPQRSGEGAETETAQPPRILGRLAALGVVSCPRRGVRVGTARAAGWRSPRRQGPRPPRA